MRVKDRFRIGSVTKTFVATVVLELVGEGKRSLGGHSPFRMERAGLRDALMQRPLQTREKPP